MQIGDNIEKNKFQETLIFQILYNDKFSGCIYSSKSYWKISLIYR